MPNYFKINDFSYVFNLIKKDLEINRLLNINKLNKVIAMAQPLDMSLD